MDRRHAFTLEAAINSLREGIQVVDRDLRYRYVNDAAAAHGRTTREALLGRRMTECFPGIESTAMFAALQRAIADRTDHAMTNRFTYPDGTSRIFDLRIQAHPLGCTVLSVDVTSRVEAEALLRQSEARLRLLVDGVRDYALFSMDLDGQVASWNAGAERILGFTREEVVGHHLRQLFPEDRQAAGDPERYLARVAEAGRHEEEGWRVRKDGTRFWAHAIATTLEDPPGVVTGYTEITRDLTERRSLEAQLRQAQKMEAVGQLAGGLAHDFNNALSVILSYADLLVETLPEGDPHRDDVIEIASAGRRAAELTRQLLTFSRQRVLDPRVVDVGEHLRGLTKMLQRLAGTVRIETVVAPDLRSVRVDPSQLEQVVMNLVVNARDAMPGGGRVLVEATNADLDADYARTHHEAAAGPHVVIAVTDTGIGMDRETQARIFEPFFTTKAVGMGTGLGLSTVYGIVKQSRGHIWVYSEPGLGTVFKIYLPAAPADGAAPAPVRRVPAAPGGHETILLVDDDDALRTVAATILRRAGYTVLEAIDGDEARAALEGHGEPVDLLLADVVLPGLSGPELARALRTLQPDLEALFMSGYARDAPHRRDEIDPARYLEKPITPEVLVRRVRAALDG